MQGVREKLGVKSVEWKVEKRDFEKNSQVMRIGNGKLKKAMVLGWYERLERMGRCLVGSKTVLYWKKVLLEDGMDVERKGRNRE